MVMTRATLAKPTYEGRFSLPDYVLYFLLCIKVQLISPISERLKLDYKTTSMVV